MNWLKQNWIKIGIGILILGVVFIVSLGIFSFAKSKIVSIFFKKDCSKLIPKNPYPQGIGEYGGFDWSMLDRGSRDCEAYNEPFIAGCMEHIKQEISYNKCLNNQSEVEKYEAVKPILLTCKENESITTESDEDFCLSDWGN